MQKRARRGAIDARAKITRFNFDVTLTERDVFRGAARKEGLSMAAWARRALLRAAGRQ